MARPRRPWFRFYVETIHDKKIRRLTPAERWLWVTILALARSSPKPGYLLISNQHSCTEVELAQDADLHLRVVRSGIAKMIEYGMLAVDSKTESWQVTNWNDRQFESDDPSERVAKHRYKAVTKDVTVTPVVTYQRQRQITETDKSIRTNATHRYEPDSFEEDFDECWKIYPRKIARKVALKAYQSRRRANATKTALLIATQNFAKAMANEGRPLDKIMHGGTFYGPSERWLDYESEASASHTPPSARQHPDDAKVQADRRNQTLSPKERTELALDAARKMGDELAIAELSAELARLDG